MDNNAIATVGFFLAVPIIVGFQTGAIKLELTRKKKPTE